MYTGFPVVIFIQSLQQSCRRYYCIPGSRMRKLMAESTQLVMQRWDLVDALYNSKYGTKRQPNGAGWAYPSD